MSVRDLNKVILISSGLTGDVVLTLDYEDYITLNSAKELLSNKLEQLIEGEHGAIVKIGFKN